MRNTQLKKWLSENGFITKGKSFSHLCLDGGKLNIPQNSIYEFYKQFANGKLKGEKYFICEVPTKIRHFYCDFDIKYKKAITVYDLLEYIHVIRDTVNECFDIKLPVIICQRDSIQISDSLWKSGLHLIWDELCLSLDDSINLCKRIIGRLLDTNNKFNGDYDWEEIIDLQVYKGGLRMVGSLKMDKKRVGGKTEFTVIPQNYIPIMRIDSQGIIDSEYLDGNFFKYLCDCSIRCPDETEAQEAVIALKSEEDESVREENKWIDAIERYIKHWDLPKEWNDTLVSVNKTKTGYIVKTQSRYCLNNGKEHKRQNIYFQILQSGLVQKCLCKCRGVSGQKKMECSKFRSQKFKLSEELFGILFPEKKQKKRDKNSIEVGENIFHTNHQLNKRDLHKWLIMSENTINYLKKKCI